jgi:hypothetical protein
MPPIKSIISYPYSTSQTIVSFEVVFPDKSTRTFSLTKSQCDALPKNGQGQIIVSNLGQQQTFYFAYHQKPDACWISDLPVPMGGWTE